MSVITSISGTCQVELFRIYIGRLDGIRTCDVLIQYSILFDDIVKYSSAVSVDYQDFPLRAKVSKAGGADG